MDLEALLTELGVFPGFSFTDADCQQLAEVPAGDPKALARAILTAQGLDPWLERGLYQMVLEQVKRLVPPPERPAPLAALEWMVEDLCEWGVCICLSSERDRIVTTHWTDAEKLTDEILAIAERDLSYLPERYQAVLNRVTRALAPPAEDHSHLQWVDRSLRRIVHEA
jgi:hypothetical protein